MLVIWIVCRWPTDEERLFRPLAQHSDKRTTSSPVCFESENSKLKTPAAICYVHQRVQTASVIIPLHQISTPICARVTPFAPSLLHVQRKKEGGGRVPPMFGRVRNRSSHDRNAAAPVRRRRAPHRKTFSGSCVISGTECHDSVNGGFAVMDLSAIGQFFPRQKTNQKELSIVR